MTAIQRYGELELHVRLTNEVHNPIATTGYFGLHDSTYLVNKSYEECRLAYSVMANEQETSSSIEERSPALGTAKKDEAPVLKRVCIDTGLWNAVKMIKVEVGGGKKGPHEAEWLIHEKLLLANSELAKGCLAHDTTETSTDTIKMEEAGAEAFGVFVNYLYKERLESAKLDVDQLITVYLLADYVACPKFADLVFQQIHIRTHNATFTYSAIQIDHILSNTLAVHPLRTLLLDQVGRGILQKKYDFSASTEDGQLLEPHMVELMGAVVQAVKTTNICFSSPLFQSSIYPDIRHYLKHDPTSVEAETSETPSPAVTSKIDADEAEIGRHAVDYVVRESGVTRSKALNALKTNGFKPGQAIRSLKR